MEQTVSDNYIGLKVPETAVINATQLLQTFDCWVTTLRGALSLFENENILCPLIQMAFLHC